MKYHHPRSRCGQQEGQRLFASASAVSGPGNRQACCCRLSVVAHTHDGFGPARVSGFCDSSQHGSLAGAAYLLESNAGVLSGTPQQQKCSTEHKGKCSAVSALSVPVRNVKARLNDPLLAIQCSGHEFRGDRKITTGITGLWPPSVHSDVAF